MGPAVRDELKQSWPAAAQARSARRDIEGVGLSCLEPPLDPLLQQPATEQVQSNCGLAFTSTRQLRVELDTASTC